MITFEPITLQNTGVFKEVRLRALQDTPGAFRATYEEECQLSEADWAARAARWNGETGVGFVAMDEGVPCGIAGSALDANNAAQAHLLSMWIAPTHRRQGIGRLLVDEIACWAHQRGASVVQLFVTSQNEPAILFYKRLGFVETGRTEPYRNDASLIEIEMLRPITPDICDGRLRENHR